MINAYYINMRYTLYVSWDGEELVPFGSELENYDSAHRLACSIGAKPGVYGKVSIYDSWAEDYIHTIDNRNVMSEMISAAQDILVSNDFSTDMVVGMFDVCSNDLIGLILAKNNSRFAVVDLSSGMLSLFKSREDVNVAYQK